MVEAVRFGLSEVKMFATSNFTQAELKKSLRGVLSAVVDIEAAAEETTEYILEVEGDFLQESYLYDRNVEESEVDFNSEDVALDFRSFVADRAYEQVFQAMDELSSSVDIEGATVRLWRSIVVSQDWLCEGIRERPLGVCWAFKKSAAEPHWGDFGDGRRELVLEALVQVDEIDWQQTVCLNAHTDCECEIRLKETAFAHLLSAQWAPRQGAGRTSAVELDEILPAGEAAFGSRCARSPEEEVTFQYDPAPFSM